MWTGEVTEASIFPSYAQYHIRSQTGQTYKIKMSYQTSFLDLPPEMVEKIIQKFTSTQDVTNCSIALAGTRHEEFVTQKFLKPQLNYLKSQLKIFASLDLNLKESLKNEGWFEECQDTKLIVRLWKEFKPSLPGINTFDLDLDILNTTCDSLISF